MSSLRSIILVGVGPFTSMSLARKLVTQGWNIALISRTENRLAAFASELEQYKHPGAKIIFRVADAGDADSLLQALEESKKELGSVDVLCYNAARVAPEDLMTVTADTLAADFKSTAIGTLVAGQWFAANANKSKIAAREYPLLLVTGGVLHQHPYPSYASLSATKAASQNIATNFSQVLPKAYSVQVGEPLIVEPIIPKESGGYQTKSDPDVIVEKIIMPYFQDRLDIGNVEWKTERVF